jgi:5-methylcytosine-specific restriction endonuclease McrA
VNSKPWETHPKIWKTRSAFMSYVRGGIRRGLWDKNPVKLEFIKQNRVRANIGKITKSNPKGEVWGGICQICKGEFREYDLQVDHIIGKNSLTTLDDIMGFIKAIVLVTNDDLQLVCKPCHGVKTHAEKMGITLQEARLEKEAIAFEKLSKDIQVSFLLSLNYTEDQLSNSKKRRACFVDLNKGEEYIRAPE